VGAVVQANDRRSCESCTVAVRCIGDGCGRSPARAKARAMARGVVGEVNEPHRAGALHAYGNLHREDDFQQDRPRMPARRLDFFVQRGYRRVYNLAGGIDAWSKAVDSNVPRY
jgi:hypothetical protein